MISIKKTRLNLFFFSLFIILLILLPLFFNFCQNNPQKGIFNGNLNTSSEIVPLRSYDALGEFSDFSANGTYDVYDDSLNYVEFNGTADYYCKMILDFPDISGEIVTNVSLKFQKKVQLTTTNVTSYLNYTDGTIEVIHSESSVGDSTWHYFEYSVNISSSKTIKSFELFIDALGACTGYFRLTELIFRGYMPDISNIVYPETVKAGDQAYFSCDLAYYNESLNQNITFQYIETGNILEETLLTDWIGDNKYYKNIDFSTNGYYRFIITSRNDWNVTNSAFYTFYVGDYPKYSYLSMFSSLDGFPLESKDFKIYSGENEEVSLVNFRDYHGNWSTIYASVVNASLIDNYIKFNTTSNGLKTSFEDGEIIDTITANSLLFEVKALTNLRLVIIYNPTYYEKDYYIDFYSNMTDSWFNVEVPFYLFNQYNNVTNDWLSELGFWISNGTVELSNIRAAIHFNKTYLQSSKIQLNMTETTKLSETDSQSYLNSTLLTFDSLGYSSNNSLDILDGFNNSQASWENVSIPSNSSITLNNSGHYKGTYTWFDDAVGSDPTGWTVWEAGGSTNVHAEQQGHKKEVYMSDTSGAASVNIRQSFAAQTTGTVEYWINHEAVGQYDSFGILKSGGTYAVYPYVSVSPYNQWAYWDGAATKALSFKNGTAALKTPDIWYKAKIVFNCTSDTWEWYISTEVNTTYAQLYEGVGDYTLSFSSPVASIDEIWFQTSNAAQTKVYLDSIDYSWSTGYYSERIKDLIDQNSYYISDIIDFNQSYEISNILTDSSTPTNTTISICVSDNKTGSFNNWMNYGDYIGNQTQFLKYKILLNNSNAQELPIFEEINFTLTEYSYNFSQTFNISYFNESIYSFIWNSTNYFSIKTNDSSGTFNFSIYDFNNSDWFNRTFNNTNYDFLNFTWENNSIYDSENNLTHYFKIYGNSTNPFRISINLMNFTTIYNKTLYSGNYNYSLIDDFENIYFHVKNNNSLDANWRLFNTTASVTIGISNTSDWEFWDHEFDNDYGWTTFQILYQSYNNESIYLRELFETKNETYRLISEENRQNPDAITFNSETQGLAILDYFDNVLYRNTLDYTSFIDIALPIVTFTIYNWYNETIYATIERGLGVSIEILVPPSSSYSLRIFATSYQLWVRNQNLTTLLLTEFSPDSSENVIFEIGEWQAVTFPDENFWTELLNFFFGTWYGILLFVLICVAVALILTDFIQNILRWRQTRKDSKQTHKGLKKIEKQQKDKNNTKVMI